MESSLIQVALDGLKSGLLGLKNIIVIVLPLMVVIELAKDSGLMERVTSRFQLLAGFLQISKEAVLPLVVGLAIGFSYGSGVIISAARDGNLSMKDRYGITVFLSICHSLFEDTLILVAVGASLPWLLGIRLLLATAVTLLTTRVLLANGFDRQPSSPTVSG
ncbi:MAG: nucleoside recognition protein [Firmicutes bacterium]|nr:nucleoside recognition protein [Bacillota bacterium]